MLPGATRRRNCYDPVVSLVHRLERLVHKYQTLTRLRARREEVEATGATTFAAPEKSARGAEFRVLAAEFPGALRELEVTGLPRLQQRLATCELELSLARAGARQPGQLWTRVILDYHAVLRELIAIKTWYAFEVGPRVEPTGAQHTAFAAWYEQWPHRTGHVDPARIVPILRTRRRIVPLTLNLLAQLHDLEPAEVNKLIRA